MLVIGLTGGIGSGKTTVAKLFAQHGVSVIDTDQLARDVTQIGRPALKQIAEKFNSAILNADGSLNRTALRKIIFADDQNRIWLEELLHPLIREEMKLQANSAKSPYSIVIIPLLLETSANPLIDRILIVDTTENEQIKRTQHRDNATQKEVETIMKTQVSRPERLAAADDIIVNTGTLEDLKPQVDSLHGFYLALAQKNLFK